MRKRKLITYAASFLLIILALVLYAEQANAPDSSGNNSEIEQKKEAGGSEFDKSKYSITDPNSTWVVVNKKRPLPDGFVPNSLEDGLRRGTNRKLNELLQAANSNGHNLYKISAFRSQENQAQIYSDYVSRDGQAQADTYSARPRHSEHQTGLAVDLGNGTCDLEACFGDTPAGKWLAANAHKYGFVIRYQKGKENITGYQYEPWHLRYVGIELAAKVQKTGQTLEEFFGLPSAPDY